MFKKRSILETKCVSWRKEQCSQAKPTKKAMMSSISPREEQSSSKAKKSFLQRLYNEHMTSLQAGGLSSGIDHLGLMHSATDFTPSLKQEKNMKAMSNSPSRPITDGITMETSSTLYS